MENKVVVIFVFVFLLSGVFALEDWEDINVDPVVQTNVQDSGEVADVQGDVGGSDFVAVDSLAKTGNGKFFTDYFYAALVLIVFILVIIGFFVWSWIRGPKNKWDK